MSITNSSWRLTYTGVALDRAAAVRPVQADVEALHDHALARVLPVWNGNHLFEHDGVEAKALTVADAISLRAASGDLIFLGLSGDAPWFALAIHTEEEPADVQLSGVFEPLHPRVGRLDADQAAMLAYARGMVLWHANHLHCGRCGAPTESQDGGHIRTCTDEACGYRAFPRTDAAVITLVEHPDGEHCLLGRQSRWPDGMYSVVAGFVEPGESLEECVAREVKEETGIIVTDVRYQASQPWPFPSSLMLGFTAKASTTGFKPDDDELDDIRWVSREALDSYSEMGDDKPGPKLPNRHSIARMLIDNWRAEL
ncbi:MAG: NAD(+) diphosphatase [Alphaproteobacteria bacterium]|nr:NAD(+) diphosphatase [Alphaproteobacteria bacterium]